MGLATRFHSGPVTALCCHENTVLAGIGSQLYVYSVHDVSNEVVVQVLHGRNLHGIRTESETGPSRVCLFGQKCIRLVHYNPQGFQIEIITDVLEFSDWIWDVRWLKDIPSLSLALGHNVIVTYNLETQKVDHVVHCQEKCILYCAKFITDLSDSLVLAAGTVFNQVVIWSPAHQLEAEGRSKVFHRLTGHQGVIFSVDYDPLSQKICSASDDRSIRLYQVKFVRPTTSPCVEDWETMDSSLIHVLYGHSARVWNVKLLTNEFVSVGEDSTCIVWSYDGRVLHKMKGHKGKSIWSMAVDKGDKYVVTGGGDHSIRLWKLQQGRDKNTVTTVLPLQNDEDDFPRNSLMLGINRVLILTNNGLLLLYDNTAGGKITTLMADPNFSSYSVMAVSPQSGYIAVGNIHGVLRIIIVQDILMENDQNLSSTDIHLYEGRLFSIQWLGETTILTTGSDGNLKLCQLSIEDSILTVLVAFDLELAPSKQRWVSCACTIQGTDHIVCGDRAGSVYLYCTGGDKKCKKPVHTFPKLHGKGGVTSVSYHDNKVYTTGRDGLYRVFSWSTEQQELALLNSNKVYKGFDWIEKLLMNEEGGMNIHGFHTNMFVVWSVKQNQKLLEVECGGGHRAWDFCCHDNTSQFVYIKSRQAILTEIDSSADQIILKGSMHGRELCDAKHVCSDQDKKEGCHVLLTCSEDTSICVSTLTYKHGIPELRTIHTLSGHISSVRCLAVSPSSNQSGNAAGHKKLIFSGGGRAQMKIARINVEFAKPAEESVIQEKPSMSNHDTKHVSYEEDFTKASSQTQGLEHNMAEHLHSKDAYVENEQNCYSKLCQNDNQNNVSVRCSVENLTGIQLGQSGRRRKKPWRYFVENSDPETRILDIAVTNGSEIDSTAPYSLYFLSLACSDGYMRVYAFDEETREITQLGSSCYHNHCLLKTCHSVIRENSVTREDHCDKTSVIDTVISTDICGPDVKDNVEDTSKDEQSNAEDINKASQKESSKSISGTTLRPAHGESSKFITGRLIVLTAATDGIVAFWDVTELCQSFVKDIAEGDSVVNCHSERDQTEKVYVQGNDSESLSSISPFFTAQLHQSGINSLHFSKQIDGRYLLLTGGDDNAVTVSLFTMETTKSGSSVKVICQGSHKSAHAAQITGIWALSPSTILTASIDQRVCVWGISQESTQIKFQLLDCKFVDVMDIANLDVWSSSTTHHILLCGEGLQLLEIDTTERDRRTCQPKQSASLVMEDSGPR